jgi:hypothetical protein
MARGFVLGELVFAIGSLSLAWAVVESALPAFERVCIGQQAKANAAEGGAVDTDLTRWICAPLSIEPAEFRFARTRPGKRQGEQ